MRARFRHFTFTGMRKAELTRLQSRDVTSTGINLPAISTKSGRRRFIQMPPPLKAWLKAYPLEETVLPANWQKKKKRFADLPDGRFGPV